MYVDTAILMPKLIKTTMSTEVEDEPLDALKPPKKMRWDVYYIEHKTKEAALALEERFKKAEAIVRGAFSSYVSRPTEAIRAEVDTIDDDKEPKDPQILSFKGPKVAGTIANLADVQLEDETSAQFEINKIVEDNPPKITIAELKGQASVTFAELPKPARETIIKEDAEHIIQPIIGGIFDPTERLPLINMQEIERDDKPTARKPRPISV